MNRHLPHVAAAAAFTFASSFAGTVSAGGSEPSEHKLGDHPAVVVQRLQRQAGYDYATKFYPHPAWLRLHAAQPQDRSSESAAADAKAGDDAAKVARR